MALEKENLVYPVIPIELSTTERQQRVDCTRITVLRRNMGSVFGFQVAPSQGGVFIWHVYPESPAGQANLSFGDQIIQINGRPVAGCSSTEVAASCKNIPVIELVIRERRFFASTFVLRRELGVGQLGFIQQSGNIQSIIKGSQAARCGLLTNQFIIEINDKNVLGLDIAASLKEAGGTIRLTTLPGDIFVSLIKLMLDDIARATGSRRCRQSYPV